MRLFDDFMNKAEKFADQAVKVGKEAFDQTKVMAGEAMDKGRKKVKELSLESDMRDGYRKLGELVYRMEKNGVTEDGLKAQYINELAALETELEALKSAEVNENADFTVEDDTAELKEEATELFEDIREEVTEAVKEVKEAIMGEEGPACPECGSPADEDDIFCHDCGAKMK